MTLTLCLSRHNIKESITCAITKTNMLDSVYGSIAYEINVMYGGSRLLLCNKKHADITLCIPKEQLSQYMLEKFRELVCLSLVMVCGHKEQVASDDLCLFMFVEFHMEKRFFLVDGFLLSIDEYNQRVLRMYTMYHFPMLPYRCSVLLDINSLFLFDRTRYLDTFQETFVVYGHMATEEEFTHKIMMRHGLYEFMKQMSEKVNLFIITSEDIIVARTIITAANKCKWKHSIKKDEPSVYLPITHVFSVRNETQHVKKQFRHVLPFAHLYDGNQFKPYIAIDVKPASWHKNDRPYVKRIPEKCSPDDLIHIAAQIEQWLLQI